MIDKYVSRCVEFPVWVGASVSNNTPSVRLDSLNYPKAWRRVWVIAPLAVLCVKATACSLRSAVWTVWKWWKAPFRCSDKASPSRPIIVTSQNRQADSHTCALTRCGCHRCGNGVNCTSRFNVGNSGRFTFLTLLGKGGYMCAACKYNILFSVAFLIIYSSTLQSPLHLHLSVL